MILAPEAIGAPHPARDVAIHVVFGPPIIRTSAAGVPEVRADEPLAAGRACPERAHEDVDYLRGRSRCRVPSALPAGEFCCTMKRRRRQHLRAALYVLFVCALSLLVVEGFSSALVVGHTAWRALQPFDERVHTTHDAELGWRNIPNFVRPGMYGPKAGLSIDARGFRAVPSPPAAASPRLRVICSGGSFTFGVGVGDADTWCHHLTSIDARTATTNMGQIGYGVDQAFLWYRRNASEVPHDVQVLAFVSADFDRMRDATFMSYGKPVLAIEDGNLVVRDEPGSVSIEDRRDAASEPDRRCQRSGWPRC